MAINDHTRDGGDLEIHQYNPVVDHYQRHRARGMDPAYLTAGYQ